MHSFVAVTARRHEVRPQLQPALLQDRGRGEFAPQRWILNPHPPLYGVRLRPNPACTLYSTCTQYSQLSSLCRTWSSRVTTRSDSASLAHASMQMISCVFDSFLFPMISYVICTIIHAIVCHRYTRRRLSGRSQLHELSGNGSRN